MIHKTEIPGYEGRMSDLVKELGNLRYDALADFLSLLNDKLAKDGIADFGRLRLKLGGSLIEASNNIQLAREWIKKAWLISKPYMDLKDEI